VTVLCCFCRVIQLLGLLITYFLLIVQLSTSSILSSPASNATTVGWFAADTVCDVAMTTIASGWRISTKGRIAELSPFPAANRFVRLRPSSNMSWYFGPKWVTPKRHLDRFTRFRSAHECEEEKTLRFSTNNLAIFRKRYIYIQTDTVTTECWRFANRPTWSIDRLHCRWPWVTFHVS